MKTVILVGAGATLAESLPSRPAKDRYPPLDATFFKLCDLAKLYGRATVRNYMIKSYGLNPFERPYGMEEVFNLIYADATSANPPRRSLDANWALLKMYRNAIIRTTNSLEGRSQYGVGALLRFLLRTDREADPVFVTFNQDLVIEKAIEYTISLQSYSHLHWDIRKAYELIFDVVGNGPGSKPFTVNPEGADTSTRVLKLHGSLNWVYPVRSADDAKNSIRGPRGDLYCVDDVSIHRSLQLVGGPRAQHLVPLIVPPVYEKASHIRETLHPIWDSARKAISQADQFIIFGYSFPDADIPAKGLIRRGFFQNKHLNRVHIIDINPHMAGKAAELLDAPAVAQYRTVRDYCLTNSVA